MAGSLTLREREFLGALGVFAAYDVSRGCAAAEPQMRARGAHVLAVVALAITAAGSAGMLARDGVGLIARIPLRRTAVFGVTLNCFGAGHQAHQDAFRAWSAA